MAKYDEKDRDEILISHEPIRPSFVINTLLPFSEDFIAEMRLGACLFRNVGPTIRCNAIRTNWGT